MKVQLLAWAVITVSCVFAVLVARRKKSDRYVICRYCGGGFFHVYPSMPCPWCHRKT